MSGKDILKVAIAHLPQNPHSNYNAFLNGHDKTYNSFQYVLPSDGCCVEISKYESSYVQWLSHLVSYVT